MASSPEAMLIAAIIRQSVEDYAFTEASVAHLKTRKYARRLRRFRVDAERFIFTGLTDFLNWYDVEHLFNAETIVRSVRRIYCEVVA